MGWQNDDVVVAAVVVVQGPGGGEFVYDAAGNLRSANVGQVTTDPLQGITCQQGFSTFNGHGAVINLLSTSKGAFYQYADTGTNAQGGLVLAIAVTGGTDPVNGSTYIAGGNLIDPVFGDFLEVVGARIRFFVGVTITNPGSVRIQAAPANNQNPYLGIDAPEQGTGTHVQALMQGTSPDGTSLGQMLIGLVTTSGTLTPVTNAMLEVQGVSGATDPAIGIIVPAAGQSSLAVRATGDTSNRFRVSATGGVTGPSIAEGPGNATQDTFYGRIGAGLFGLKSTDLDIQTIGRGIRIAEGANARMGVATLAAGTVTIANSTVTANTRIDLMRQAAGGALGHLSSTRVAGTSFTIISSSNTETSTVAWILYEPG